MLSQEFNTEFGRGFAATNLTRSMKFSETFPDEQILATLSQQLSCLTSVSYCRSSNRCNGNFMPRCAAWKAGAFEPSGGESNPCSTNEQHSPENRKSSLGRSSRS